ncbi:hypothetical protein [Tautonia marina]|uniref:hypothetical protein n=1 Tax=Tautonia marina TaxID=2653855 RepID=UPI001260C189|nr:hypothetical protein [Tautonia marina]
MDTTRRNLGRLKRPPCLGRLAILAALTLALAPTLSQAGPISDRAQVVAAQTAAQQALLSPNAGTLRADALAARAQSVQLRSASILNSQAFQRQEAFFARALEQGLARVPRPQFLDVLLVPDVSGLLAESSTLDYLRWRRNLNPTRFDRNHPFIGPALERDRLVRNQSPLPMPPVTVPTNPEVPIIPPTTPEVPGPILGGGRPSPQVPIPEPASIALWAVLGLGGCSFAWKRRRQTSR